ncbi:inner membrane protein [Escherichia coli]|nr:inner membrane protein [Escherichia coli]
MFLNYFALGVLIFVFLVIFYGIIAIHDIPYLIAKKRNHPHADAIHTAGWVSLFTLPCYLAVSVDLGDALSTGAWLGYAVTCCVAGESD